MVLLDRVREILQIGPGEIGGKAAHLNRAIGLIRQKSQKGELSPALEEILAVPDSVSIGTGLFDEFMATISPVTRAEIEKAESGAEYDYDAIQKRVISTPLTGSLTEALQNILENRQRPLIVRSSSLLEDGEETSFAGMYDSVFVGTLGDRNERLQRVGTALKGVYASTYNPDAIDYRKRFMLLKDAEKMSVLVQEVVGKEYKQYHLPLVAGVMFTLNPYRWDKGLRKEDGLVRIVFGLGTRAVSRGYARTYSPSKITNRPEGNEPEKIRQYAQENADVIDLSAGALATVPVSDLIISSDEQFPGSGKLIRLMNVRPDRDSFEMAGTEWNFQERGGILYFDDFLAESVNRHTFTQVQRELAGLLEEANQDRPVDYEFAFDGCFNLLQCRPLSQRREHKAEALPDYARNNPEEHVLFEAKGNVPSAGIHEIAHIVFVDWDAYRELRQQEKHMVGDVINAIDDRLGTGNEKYVLIGPGRWGSTSPELGVPVRFNHISNCSALVEYSRTQEHHSLAPEASFGSHFFMDLMECDIAYVPLSPFAKQTLFREDVFQEGKTPERGGTESVRGVVRVLDLRDRFGTTAALALDGETETGALYLEKSDGYRPLSRPSSPRSE